MTVRNAATMGTYGSSWQRRGYSGSGNVKHLLDVGSGPAIVAGGAEGVFDEILEVQKHIPNTAIFAVNEVGIFLPIVDHFITLHTANVGAWKQCRWLHPKEGDTLYHGIDKLQSIDFVWEGLTPMFALSGYFAMQIAWLMGYSPIILCGIPGDSRRRFFDLRARDNFGYGGGHSSGDDGIRQQVEKEMQRLPDFKDAVRSMNGWTKEFFGGF